MKFIILITTILLLIPFISGAWEIEVGNQPINSGWGVDVTPTPTTNFSAQNVSLAEIWKTTLGNLDNVNISQFRLDSGFLGLNRDITFNTLNVSGDTKLAITSGRVSIGTNATPLGSLDIRGTAVSVYQTRFSDNANAGAGIVPRRARGTQSTPSTVQAQDKITTFMNAQGYDGTNYITGAGIEVYVDGTPGTNDLPSRIEFKTQKDGEGLTMPNIIPAMIIKEDNKIGIGATVPDSLFHINSSSSTILKLQTTSASDPTLIFNTTNTPNQINVFLDENLGNDRLVFQGQTASVDTTLFVQGKDGEVGGFRLASGTRASVIQQSASDDLIIRNTVQDEDIYFQVNDGGVTMTPLRLVGSTSNVRLPNDNQKILFGAGQDWGLFTDGTDLFVNREVGTGDLIIENGNVGIGITSPTAKLEVKGSLNQTNGNTTLEGIYGELRNKSYSGFETVNLVTPEVYVAIEKLETGYMNGFHSVNGTGNMTAQIDGVYNILFSASIEKGSVSEYGVKLYHNNVAVDKCYSRFNTIANMGGTPSFSCLLRLSVGDIINVRMDDHTNPVNDPIIGDLNLNIVRIGN